jgi:RimJ/RimL family protein N-acetyltransferase
MEIVTERLGLRPFQASDLPDFVAYRSDPEVARYQSWDGTYSMADAERFSPRNEALRSAVRERGCSWPRSTGSVELYAATAPCALRPISRRPPK